MRHFFQRRPVIEVLGHPHVIIERDVFRHVAQMRAGLKRLLENIVTGDRCSPGGGRHEAGENPHRSAFAGTVRPEETHDLALADFEIQIVNRRLTSVAFSEILDLDHEAVMLSDN